MFALVVAELTVEMKRLLPLLKTNTKLEHMSL